MFFACFRLNFPANVISSAAPVDSLPTNTAVGPAATPADTAAAFCDDPADAFSINTAAAAAALTEELSTKTLSPAAAPTDASVADSAGAAARLRARCR